MQELERQISRQNILKTSASTPHTVTVYDSGVTNMLFGKERKEKCLMLS
jgi:hypothetical protein